MLRVENQSVKKNDKQKNMLELIANDPFINDMQIACRLGVSIQTVRLYRHEMDIPELRLRIAMMAQANMDSVKSLDGSELLGEILELKLNTAGKSLLKINDGMLYGRGRIASGQFIFEHANTLAIALIDAEMAVTGVAKLRYKKPVFAGDMIVASAQVIRIRGNKYFVTVISRRGEEEVFRAKFIIVGIDDFKRGIFE